MGRRLAAALAALGLEVRILCLPHEQPTMEAFFAGSGPGPQGASKAGKVSIVIGDITRKESLAPGLQGVETVFHLAAVLLAPGRPEIFQSVNADGTRNLMEASQAAGAGHFIYVSSISVEYPRSNAYSRSKAQGETWVKASRIPYTIVRPCLAYADGGALEFMGFVDHLRRGPIVLLPAGGRALKSPVHIDDLVAGLSALPGNPKAFGKTYAFSGGEILSLRRMASLVTAHMGRPKPIVGVPAWICLLGLGALWLLEKATGRKSAFTFQTYTGLIQDAAPSHLAAAQDLGYRPRGFREGLAGLVSLRGVLGKCPR